MVMIIDNTNIKLSDFIRKRLKNSKEAKFALGYFFLSGWNIVKNDLPENPKDEFLKIVIGDETTEDTAREISKGYRLRVKTKIIEELSETKNEDRINELYEMIKNRKVDVKIYDKGKLHAKLYLFLEKPEELNDVGSSPGVAVVGSSNFTRMGLTTNKELNVVLTDRDVIIDLNKWFDKLWEESSEFREELLKIIEISLPKGKKEGLKLGKYITPKELFKYLVWKWFDGRIEPVEKREILADFQLIGVINAINIINNYNGVIIADSVGLGKSFIGATLIEEYLLGKLPQWDPNKYGINKDRKALLILPPSLIPQWEELLLRSPYFFGHSGYYVKQKEENGLNTDKYRVYEIYKTNNVKVGEIGFISLGIFSSLGESVLEYLSWEYDLILIDEAHKFRNPQTNRWRNARALRFKADKAFQNKFILLTATPLNNTIWDIYYLIKMFSDDFFLPFKARGVNITELFREYKEAKKKYKETLDYKTEAELKLKAQEIKEKVLNEVMILRTRKYILENFGKDGKIKIGDKEVIFKEPQPEKVMYDDIKEYSEYWDFLKNIANDLENLEFAYTKLYTSGYVVIGNSSSSLFEEKPEDVEKEKIAVPINLILKLLVAKRLESSIYAFEKTLRKIYKKNNALCDILEELKLEVEQIITNQDRKLDELFNRLKEIGNKILEVAGKEEIVEEEEIGEEEYTYNPKVRMLINLLSYGEEKIELSFNTEDEAFTYLKKHPELINKLKEGVCGILNEMKKDNEIIEKILDKLDNVKVKDEKGNPCIIGKIIEDNKEYPIYAYKDPKLKKLMSLMYNELVGKKYIIFTQYKDTAIYLYHSLIKYIERQKSTLSYLFDTKRGKLKIGLVTGDLSIEEKERMIKRFAPSVNNGYDVVEREGGIEILVSTDSLSEGVNLQEGDGVVNYDLPWNPMIIVQRVGRVSRIGNEKDVFVKNFVPVQEIEISLGILEKLQEKIKDITLLVGKEFYILSSTDEEITIETFGEKIKSLAELSLTELEEISADEETKKFMDLKIPEEVKAEFELLDFVQNKLGLKKEDFEDIKELLSSKVPVYTLTGNNEIYGVFEVFRGNLKIGKKVVVYKDGTLKETTCREFIKLWNCDEIVDDVNFENISNSILDLKDKFKEEILKKYKSKSKSRGFMRKLYNYLYQFKRQKTLDDSLEKNKLDSVLSFLSWCELNTNEIREFKEFLKSNGIIDDKENIIEKNPKRIADLIYDYFNIGLISKKLDGKMIAWWR